jgi:hypothetical protein
VLFDQQFFSPEMITKYDINTTFLGEFRILVKNAYDAKAVENDIRPHIAKGKQKYQYIEVSRQAKICELLRHMTIS